MVFQSKTCLLLLRTTVGGRVEHPPPPRNMHLGLENVVFEAISRDSATAFASGLVGMLFMNVS